MKRRYGLLLVVALIIGASLPILIGREALVPVLARLPVERLVMMLGIIFVAWNLNAGRLRLLTGGMGLHLRQGRALATVMATEFAICATPGGTGGPLTFAWLLKREGLPMPRGAALYVADQLVDMVFFVSALLAFGLYWLVFPSDMHLGWQVAVLASLLTSGLFAGRVGPGPLPPRAAGHRSPAAAPAHQFRTPPCSGTTRAGLPPQPEPGQRLLPLASGGPVPAMHRPLAAALQHSLSRSA